MKRTQEERLRRAEQRIEHLRRALEEAQSEVLLERRLRHMVYWMSLCGALLVAVLLRLTR